MIEHFRKQRLTIGEDQRPAKRQTRAKIAISPDEKPADILARLGLGVKK